MFRPIEDLELNELLVFKDSLMRFELTSINDIKKLWAGERKNELDYPEKYINQDDLPYIGTDPLYMKMIHRFRNCNNRIAQFYHQIDPNNQRKLLAFGFNAHRDYDPKRLHQMVTFLAWITNMLGRYEIQPDKVEAWERIPITYFYMLTMQEQIELLDRYNKREIRAMNEIMKNYLNEQITNLESMNLEDDLEASE